MNAEEKKAPWTDFVGNDIYDGDRIIHPSGQEGKVVYNAELQGTDSDKWLVDYGLQPFSRLCLQIGDKGMAIVLTHHRKKSADGLHSSSTGDVK